MRGRLRDVVSIVLPVVLVVVVASACGRDSEPPTKAAGAPAGWRAGTVVSRQGTDTLTAKVTKVGADGARETMQDDDRVTTASWLEKCVDVNPKGGSSHYVVFMREWSQRRGDTTDDSLRGRWVDVIRGIQTWRWSLRGREEKPVTQDARKWLEDRFGAGRLDDEALRRLALPEPGLAVGATWKPDLGGLVDWARERRMGLDPATATATARLVAADGPTRRVSIEVDMPGSHAAGAPMAWMHGGTLSLRGEVDLSPAAAVPVVDQAALKGSLEGEAVTNGAALEVAARFEWTMSTTLGGDFPEPAKD